MASGNSTRGSDRRLSSGETTALFSRSETASIVCLSQRLSAALRGVSDSPPFWLAHGEEISKCLVNVAESFREVNRAASARVRKLRSGRTLVPEVGLEPTRGVSPTGF